MNLVYRQSELSGFYQRRVKDEQSARPRRSVKGKQLKNLPEEVKEHWLVWRLYMEGKLSLSEFHLVDLDQVDLANRLLDSVAAAQETKWR